MKTEDLEDTTFFKDSWQHLMGALDTVLEDIRTNAATLRHSHEDIDALLRQAEDNRAAATSALRELAQQRQELATNLDEMQRLLAVEGAPLRGEIT